MFMMKRLLPLIILLLTFNISCFAEIKPDYDLSNKFTGYSSSHTIPYNDIFNVNVKFKGSLTKNAKAIDEYNITIDFLLKNQELDKEKDLEAIHFPTRIFSYYSTVMDAPAVSLLSTAMDGEYTNYVDKGKFKVTIDDNNVEVTEKRVSYYRPPYVSIFYDKKSPPFYTDFNSSYNSAYPYIDHKLAETILLTANKEQPFAIVLEYSDDPFRKVRTNEDRNTLKYIALRIPPEIIAEWKNVLMKNSTI